MSVSACTRMIPKTMNATKKPRKQDWNWESLWVSLAKDATSAAMIESDP